MRRCDALVVGGGLAGGAAAVLLAEAGRDVVLLERTRGPHDKVCGEFLSAEALEYLRVLGVDVGALGALPIGTLRFTRRNRTSAEVLPFRAMSLTRRMLDEALLRRAAEAGATVCRGVAVESLTRSDDGDWVAATESGEFVAPAAFLATGKHDLRGHARPVETGPMRHGNLLAFNLYVRLRAEQAAALRGAIEVYLFRHGYCGLQMVEDGTANLGLLVRQGEFKGWAALRSAVEREVPLLGERLQGSEEVLAKPLALSAIPYGYRRAETRNGLWAVGDQAAVIPSFSGDGMSIALHSGVRAARMFLAGESARVYQAALAQELRAPVRVATGVSRLLVGMPGLVSVVRRVPGVMRQVALWTRVPVVNA